MLKLILQDVKETENFGKQLNAILNSPFVVVLKGELGSGKTSLVRGYLQGLSEEVKVKSPTFPLVEIYSFPNTTVFHFDLYRIEDPKELEMIGFGEYFNEEAIIFIEWPENAKNAIPRIDLQLELTVIPKGRELKLISMSEKGREALGGLNYHA